MTPEEVWSGRKPAISHFRVFGSLCFKHIPDERRKKLDNKEQPIMFLRYDSTGSYKLYNLTSKKIVLSKDVAVDESKGWRWETTTKNGKVTIPIQLDMQSENCAKIVQIQPCRPQRRFEDYTSIPHFEVTKEGDMMHLVLLAKTKLVSFAQAIREPEWKATMEEELRAIEKNHTWELIVLPYNKRSIGVKWVYKVTIKPNGEVAKYKVRLVAKGWVAPMAKIEAIRLVVVATIFRGWSLHQLDVKSIFLNEPLEEEVYVCQPPGFEVTRHENKVYRLKVLYGLKQVPRAWNKRIDYFLLQLDFNKCTIEYEVFMIKYVVTMTLIGVVIKLVVELSSCEAEYIATPMGSCQALWLNLMPKMKIRREEPMKILINNKSVISLAKHHIAHGRSKHIETKLHFLRNQVVDILTKPLKGDQFKMARDMIGVQPITNMN
ncbi:hypothetical protein CR513_52816, partial [Mucuna pruriens]